MADKVYKNIDAVLEKEYTDLSDEAIDKFGKGERLDPEKQKRYDEVKGKISAQIKDSDVPAVDNKERLAPGGLVGEFQRAGHYVHDVTDKSFKVNGTPFKIVANDKAGFDVYYGDKKVADDIGNHKDFIALMEKIIKQGGIE